MFISFTLLLSRIRYNYCGKEKVLIKKQIPTGTLSYLRPD